MKIPTGLLQILRMFSLKRNEAQVLLNTFHEYLKRYAKHYVNQKRELSKFLTISYDELVKELKTIQADGFIEIITDTANDLNIFIPYFYIDTITKRYTDIETRSDIPFPLMTDLPRNFPVRFLKQILMSDDFAKLKENPSEKDFLYALNYSSDIPSLVFPGFFVTHKMLDLALSKIRFFLSKDDARDYMQKRLSLANPGKELTVKTFISQTAIQNANSFQSIKNSSENYILWGQFCTFIKQEFAKKNERLPDEIALLQAIGIVEYMNNFYRNSAQKDIQSETALKNLMLAFQKSPYYFSMKQISEFKDSRGIPLLGQYTEETFQNFMRKKTGIEEADSIPDILTFTNSSGERFYALAEKIVPLLVFLINEARTPIRKACIKKWQMFLINFEQDDSMKNDNDFSLFLRSLVSEMAENLYGLLNASFFMSLASDPRLNEVQLLEIQRIFPDGKIAPYQEILMLDRTELLNDTKIMLPFWYTIPIIFSIVSFFKRKQKKPEKNAAKAELGAAANTSAPPLQRLSLKDAADIITKRMLPENMDLDTILERKLDAWNQNLNPVMRENLTEDVNAFIRDYIKGVQKTLSGSNFNEDRLKTLAQTLAETKSLQKIKDKAALQSYIEFYILKLIKKYF